MNRAARIACLCCLLLLAGSAGCLRLPQPGPPVSWWILQPAPPAADASLPAAATPVYLARVELPEYLAHPNLVRRLGPERLEYLSGHRWAEPLESQVPRVLARNLLQRLGPGSLLTTPPSPPQPLPELRVRLLRIDAGPDQNVRLEAWIEFVNYLDRRLLLQRLVRLETPAGQENEAAAAPDPAALAAAHSQLLGRLADAIAQALPELPPVNRTP